MNLKETIRRVLKEETELPTHLKRRMRELPNYLRATYKWLNVNAFDSFEEFVERVIFSTTRDFVAELGETTYEEYLEIIDKSIPFFSEIIYNDYLEEIKDYYEKEKSR